MNKNIIIEGGSSRYLSELPEFKDGLPFGVINKTKTDVGGTYCAINCKFNYIVVCPFKDLVDSIYADKNNKYQVFKCYGGVRESSFKKYIKENQIHKIAVTYDSLPKLVTWLDNTSNYKILVDEYHLILEDMDYRYDAINGLMNIITTFNHYSFLSATPLNIELETEFLKTLPHYTVKWDGLLPINVLRYKTNKIYSSLSKFIQIFLDEGYSLPDLNGETKNVEELYIFINSVKGIKQVLDTLDLPAKDVKICCANKNANRLQLGEYKIESVSSPNKKINMFTKKCFQGCNLFTNNGLTVVISDANKDHTLVDIATSMEQIVGRIRTNNDYQNIFRHYLVHIFTTNSAILEDDEFDSLMKIKEEEANKLLSLQDKITSDELAVVLKKLDVDSDIVSIIDNKLVYNELKKQAFIHKQELKKSYKTGLTLRSKFNESVKFIPSNQCNLEDFDIKMAKATTVSYQQLLKDYLDNPSESYELEYPEFKEFKTHLKESEMNTLGWNKEKMLKAIESKNKLDQVFMKVYKEDFISNKDLKDLFTKLFKEYNIKITPKASLIEQCNLYEVKSVKKKINKKDTRGYMLGKLKFLF